MIHPRRSVFGAALFLAATLVLTAGFVAVARGAGPDPNSPEGKAAALLSALSQGGEGSPTTASPSATSAPAGDAAEEPQEPIHISASGTFDVRFQGADIRQALRIISAQGPWNIILTHNVSGTVTAEFKGVTFKEALDAILKIGGFVSQEKGNFIYVMTPKELEDSVKAEQKLTVQTFHLSYITAVDAKTLITPALSTDGTVAVTPLATAGVSPSNTDAGGDSLAASDMLVIKDYDENLRNIAAILREADVRPDQVLLEATILNVTLNETNQLGVDLSVLSGVNFDTLGNPGTIGTGNTSPNPVSVGTLPNGNLPRSASGTPLTSTNTAFNVPTGGMTFGFISNNVSAFIGALETVNPVTVLANPKILMLNKQHGEVFIGKHQGYLTTTFSGTQSTQTIEYLDTGTRLVVRPFIGKDGYVRLELHPEDSIGNVQTVGQNLVPNSTITQVTSNVMVRDGHTIVIGGLFKESTTSDRAQVPVLGNVPYLGSLFRSTNDTTTRQEVIILLTPRVIKQDNDEAVSEQLKDDVERFRVGARKYLRWWGADRLAEQFVRQAKQDLQEGRRDWALWNVDMALSMAPQLDEAISLKERVTEKALWADESRSSAIEGLIQKMIMNDLGKPVSTVIYPDKPADAKDVDPEVRAAMGMAPRIHQALPRPARWPALATQPASAPAADGAGHAPAQ